MNGIVCFLLLGCCISVIQAGMVDLGRMNLKAWEPGNGVSRADFIRCRGLPCADWERRQLKLMKLKAMEMKDGDDDFYTEDELIVKTPKVLSRDAIQDIDLDGCQWLSEEDIDDAMKIESPKTSDDFDNMSFGSFSLRRKRKVHQSIEERKWSFPIIYKFDGSQEEAADKSYVRGAIKHFEAQTCIKFKEVDSDAEVSQNHIVITNDYTSCHSWIGMQGHKAQILNLMHKCMYDFGKVIHAFAHTLGVWHEHQRDDRDDFIDVNWSNMGPVKAQFLKMQTHSLGTTYDFGSVMHYSWHEGSKNAKYTLIPKMKNPRYKHFLHNMGQRTGLSFNDAKALNNVYCKDSCITKLEGVCLHNGYQDPNQCNSCKCLPAYSGRYCEKIAPSNAECGGKVFVDSKSFIESPNYPDRHYMNHIECTWHITTRRDKKLQVSFESPFAIYAKNRGVCHHWVEIMYQDELDTPGARFCGQYRPLAKIVSDKNEMIVMLRANYTTGPITQRLGFKLAIESIAAPDQAIRAASDDISDRVAPPYKFYCSFEKNSNCDMIQSNKDERDWKIHSGDTSSRNTGPSGALDGEFYLYFEASHIYYGDVARISTPSVPRDGMYCLNFYYSMNGNMVNKLRVYRQSGSDQSLTNIWQKQGDQGSNWILNEITYKLQKGDSFSFEATRGKGYRGDIAIDDISVENC